MRYLTFLLVILINGLYSTIASAVNTNPISESNLEIAKQANSGTNIYKPKKMGFLKKWLVKRLVKKIKKKAKKEGGFELDQTKLANMSLTFGVISFLLLILGFFAPVLWIIAGLLAIAGDVTSLKVLRNTKDDKDRFRKQRTIAKTGLVFSLLTGLIPLGTLIAFLIVF